MGHQLKHTIQFLCMISFFVTLCPLSTVKASGGPTWSWLLPFEGNLFITNGPSEDLHRGYSAEAIDFLLPTAQRGVSIPVTCAEKCSQKE